MTANDTIRSSPLSVVMNETLSELDLPSTIVRALELDAFQRRGGEEGRASSTCDGEGGARGAVEINSCRFA
jgi:hypothetical protein